MTDVSFEQLLAESIPDGTFGGRRRPGGPDPEAAAHCAALEAALDEAAGRGAGRPGRPLRAVPETAS